MVRTRVPFRFALIATLTLVTLGRCTTFAQTVDTQTALTEVGLRRVGNLYELEADIKLPDGLKQVRLAKSKVDDTEKKRLALDREVKSLGYSVKQLNDQIGDLNSRIRQTKDRTIYNQLARTYNDTLARMTEQDKLRSKKIEEMKTLPDYSDEYASAVIDLCGKCEATIVKYNELAADLNVNAALVALSATGPKVQLGPSGDLTRQLVLLRKERQAVSSAAIKCDVQGGVARVNVVLCDTVIQQIIVDSGASTVLLTAEVAEKIGLDYRSARTKTKGQVADGKIVEMAAMVIPSIRLGRFRAENVPCVVLPKGTKGTKGGDCLLGGAFLGRFSYRLDLNGGLLYLSQKEPDNAAIATIGPAPAPAVTAAPASPSEELLYKSGLVKTAAAYLLDADARLAVNLRDMRASKARSDGATQRRFVLEREIRTLNDMVENLAGQIEAANAKLQTGKKAKNNDFTPINDMLFKLRDAEDKKKAKTALIQKLGDARGEYVAAVKAQAERMETAAKRYTDLTADAKVKAALIEINSKSPQKFTLGPSAEFQKELPGVRAEREAINDVIIRFARGDETGGTAQVPVTLNSAVIAHMVFDSGASSISLSNATAQRAGLTPGVGDPEVHMMIANGKTITGHRMTLKTVQLGPYVVENVECTVLPAALKDAPDLLGGTALQYFDYRMDLTAGELHVAPFNIKSVKVVPYRPQPAVAESTAPGKPPAGKTFPSGSAGPNGLETSQWTELLDKADPSTGTGKGQWRRDGTMLRFKNADEHGVGSLIIPYITDGSYEFQLRVTRHAPKGGSPEMTFPVGPTSAHLSMGGGANGKVFLRKIDGKMGKEGPATYENKKVLTPNREAVFDVRVLLQDANVEITVKLDGQQILRWQGAQSSITTVGDKPAPANFQLKGWTDATFSSLKVHLLSGHLKEGLIRGSVEDPEEGPPAKPGDLESPAAQPPAAKDPGPTLPGITRSHDTPTPPPAAGPALPGAPQPRSPSPNPTPPPAAPATTDPGPTLPGVRRPTAAAPPPDAAAWTDLMASPATRSKTMYGRWTRQGNTLVAQPNGPRELGRVSFPVTTSGSYDLELKFTRTDEIKGSGGASIIIPVGSTVGNVMLGWESGKLFGLGMIDGAAMQQTPAQAKRSGLIVTGQECTVVLQVRIEGENGQVTIQFNGGELVKWSGPLKSLTYRDVTAPVPFSLNYWGAEIRYSSLKVRPLTGSLEECPVSKK